MPRIVLVCLTAVAASACVFDSGGLPGFGSAEDDAQASGPIGWPETPDGGAPALVPVIGDGTAQIVKQGDRADGGSPATDALGPAGDGKATGGLGSPCPCGAGLRCHQGVCRTRCWANTCRISGCANSEYCHPLDKAGNGVCLKGRALGDECSQSRQCAQNMICVEPCGGGKARCRALCSFGCKPSKELCSSLKSSTCQVCVPKELVGEC